MTNEYTPMTNVVRNDWVNYQSGHRAPINKKRWTAEFDRWLEAHDREVAEKAWDEGFSAGERDVFEHEQHGFTNECITNPYCEGAGE